MENVIIVVVLLAIAGSIVVYLLRAKKRGKNCIGCPYAKQCAKRHECSEIKKRKADN